MLQPVTPLSGRVADPDQYFLSGSGNPKSWIFDESSQYNGIKKDICSVYLDTDIKLDFFVLELFFFKSTSTQCVLIYHLIKAKKKGKNVTIFSPIFDNYVCRLVESGKQMRIRQT